MRKGDLARPQITFHDESKKNRNNLLHPTQRGENKINTFFVSLLAQLKEIVDRSIEFDLLPIHCILCKEEGRRGGGGEDKGYQLRKPRCIFLLYIEWIRVYHFKLKLVELKETPDVHLIEKKKGKLKLSTKNE